MPKRQQIRNRLAECRQQRADAGLPKHGGPLALQAAETLTILKQAGYTSPEDGVWIDLSADLRRSTQEADFYPDGKPLPFEIDSRPTVNVKFKNVGTFTAALQHLAGADQPSRVCVLNFASARHPGGGFKSGARAQEEDLCRASGLYPTLTRNMGMYARVSSGLYTDRMIYSPQVPVFRDGAGALLGRPICCDVVSAAACNMKAVKGRESGKVDEVMGQRTLRMLQLVQGRGARSLVLGAWGTGVFRLDPYDVAEWFSEALQHVHFDEVVFAIPDSSKLDMFEEVFEDDRLERTQDKDNHV